MASVIWADRPSGFYGGFAPEPAGHRPRGRRRWAASLTAALLLGTGGFAQGARTAIGFDGVRALASDALTAAPSTRTHQRNALGGSFWAPSGSTARPPEAHPQGRRWTPETQTRPARDTEAGSSPAPSRHPPSDAATPAELR